MEPLTIEDMRAAARQLAKSHRGQRALRVLLNWLDDDGLGLDAENQEAVLMLLQGVFVQFPGSGRDAMREALGLEAT